MEVEEVFVKILADHLNKRVSVNVETDELIKYSKEHQVSAIVRYQIFGKDRTYQLCLLHRINYLRRQSLEREIASKLEEEKIPFFFVKGTQVASFYPIPALRTMGDSDLVVENRDKVKAIMEELGFVLVNVETSDWHFKKNGFDFEVHNRLLYGNLLNSQKHLQFFGKCWDYVENNQLDWNFHFLFLIEHIRKHLVWEGVGFRQFMDLAVMIKYGNDLFDWMWIRQQLDKLEMLVFAETCFGLINRWFDIAPPFFVSDLDDAFYQHATKMILKNGVFGFSSEKYESEKEREIYLGESGDDSYLATLLKRYIKRAFPPYEELIIWSQYKLLLGKRYLLPVFWVYRLFRSIFNTTKWKKNIRWSHLSKDQYEKYNNELKKWGL